LKTLDFIRERGYYLDIEEPVPDERKQALILLIEKGTGSEKCNYFIRKEGIGNGLQENSG
jgi:hypothetical protein